MLPELFTIPFVHLPIHTYGVLLVTGFLVATYIGYRRCVQYKMYENDFLDFAFWALVGGILGARFVFIAVEWRDYFVEDPWVYVSAIGIHIPRVLALWQGGLVYWGSFIGGFVAFLLFARKRNIKLLVFADLAIVAVPLAQMFGRLGCVAAGCCWGKAYYHLDEAGKIISDLPLAMRFPPGSSAYGSMLHSATAHGRELILSNATTLPLFPSQLAEGFGTMCIFFILYWLSPRKWFHGQLLLSYLVLYSVMRSFLEMYRGDDAERGYVIAGLLSTSQFISLVVVIIAAIAMVIIKKKRDRALNI